MVVATHIFQILFQVIDKATKNINVIAKQMKMVATEVNRVSAVMKGFTGKLLGIGLGMTFFMFGIQIQLQRMLRNMFQVFKEATGEQGKLMEGFNVIRVSLAAISIAFWDAFAQSNLMHAIISQVINLADWFMNLSEKTRKWITEVTAKAVVLAISVSFLGQLALGLNTLLGFFSDVKGGWVKTFAGVGTVLTIGLAVASIEDFIKGDVIKGIIDTTATVIAAYGVYGIIKGKAGAGWLFAIAVGLNLVGKGVFFQTILGIAGLIFGVFSGLGEYIVAIIIWGVKNAWNDAQSVLKALTGVSLPRFKDIRKQPDFTDIMTKDIKGWFQVGYQRGKGMDETMQGWINELENNTNALNRNTATTQQNTEQPYSVMFTPPSSTIL